MCVLEAGCGAGGGYICGESGESVRLDCGHWELTTCWFQRQYPRQAWVTQPTCFLLRANRGAEAGTRAAEGQGADGSQEAVGHLGAGGERGV